VRTGLTPAHRMSFLVKALGGDLAKNGCRGRERARDAPTAATDCAMSAPSDGANPVRTIPVGVMQPLSNPMVVAGLPTTRRSIGRRLPDGGESRPRVGLPTPLSVRWPPPPAEPGRSSRSSLQHTLRQAPEAIGSVRFPALTFFRPCAWIVATQLRLRGKVGGELTKEDPSSLSQSRNRARIRSLLARSRPPSRRTAA
jgi:hypothetical protein